MRIFYFHDEMYPSRGTDTQQVMKNLEGLTRAGGHLTLCLPRFPGDWRTSDSALVRRLFDFYGVKSPFEVRAIFCPIPYSRLRAEKLYHGLVGTAISLFRRPDLIYSRNVPPVLAALQAGKPVLYETYKPLPRALPGLWATLRPWVNHPRFVGIITHSEFARAVFIEHGVSPERIVALHNGFDPDEMAPRLTTADARRQLGLPLDVPMVGYAGNMQESKNVPCLIDVVAGIPDARLLLVGGTDEQRRNLESYAATRMPGRLLAQGWVEGYHVPRYLYACDVLAIPPSGRAFHRGHDTVLPMKLFQYLAAGRPLFVPDLPDTEELILDGIHGRRTPPDRPETNTAQLAELLTDKTVADPMARRCLETAADLTWERRGQRILDFIHRGLSQ